MKLEIEKLIAHLEQRAARHGGAKRP